MQAFARWRRAVVVATLVVPALVSASTACAQRQRGGGFRDTIPSQAYYLGIEALYRGNYRDAQRTFNRALNSGVKTLGPDGPIRWVDSICYHAMLGETFYQWGQPAQALEQFNYAANLFLQYPRWMLRVEFTTPPRPDAGLLRVAVPWGVSQRQATPGNFPPTMSVGQGQIDASRQVQQGGVIMQPQLWPMNVIEVVRCTALAIRRRNEILGPLGPHDPISKSLVLALARGGAPPNHWSGAWVDIERGLAHAGVGELEQALDFLQRGTLVAGQFDHPLTGVALLEQGRLAIAAGNADAASGLLAEASFSAYVYEDPGVIDDAFRWAEFNRVASAKPGINTALEPALAWARRERFNHIACRLQLALAEEFMAAEDWKAATAALSGGMSALGDARNGVLGNLAAFLEAKLDYQQARPTAPAKLESAIEGQAAISLHNFQINLANEMFDAQTLPSRSAAPLYEVLLADPTPADSLSRPLESMAVMKTPHDDAFARWLLAALERRNLNAAMEVTDRAKRRRFHYALPWGGRLGAVRYLLLSPDNTLTPAQAEQRRDLMQRDPDFADTVAAAEKLHGEIQSAWVAAPDDDQKKQLARLWDDYTAALQHEEVQLGRLALSRLPAGLAFPPTMTAAELQSRLEPGQAVLIYHDSPDGLLGFLITSQASAHWNCGPSNRLAGPVSSFLRALGNYDANREMTADQLVADDWHKPSEQLALALLDGSGLAPAAITELIIVPDGLAWYVPFEALRVESENRTEPLTAFCKVRYAPTVGLAFHAPDAWRRVQRTGLAVGEMVTGEKPAERLEKTAALQAALESPTMLDVPAAAPTPMLASLLDALVVLADVDAETPDPLAWAPLPLDRAEQHGALRNWLMLPASGPQRVLLPGMHTVAERGGKAPRRRGGSAPANLPGSELFYASCGLMSAGAETVLLSRWRVGGQSTLDLVREFVQELPHASAADAWQRSVQLLRESPIDPASELRVEPGKRSVDLTGAHPFFWAGYLVVDTGWRPEAPAEAEQAAAAEPPVAAAQDAPLVPPQDPPPQDDGEAKQPPPPPSPPAKANKNPAPPASPS
jgi:tetratricopeptide (TPR) repeat protein